MNKIKYTKDFLISELHRFKRENGRVPTAPEMTNKNGYPTEKPYQNHFGSWNNALEIANLPLNITHEDRTGLETCCKCGCYKKENQRWITKGLSKGQVICKSCYSNSDYKNGNLDKDSAVGKATISEQIVKNVLNLEEKYDCNFACGFGYPIDLYDKERYFHVNVKDSTLLKDNAWHFTLTQEVTPDTYIMLGYDHNRKNVLHVWITDAVDDLVFDEKMETLKKGISITNNINSGLTRAKPWEVNVKPYDDMLHQMSQKRKETEGENCFLSNSDLLAE